MKKKKRDEKIKEFFALYADFWRKCVEKQMRPVPLIGQKGPYLWFEKLTEKEKKKFLKDFGSLDKE